MNAHQALNAGFSTKNLCTRPNQPIAPSGINEVPRVTRQGPQPMMGANMPTEMDTERAKNIAIAKQIDRLEQQIREALWARTTAHKGEERVLKDAFLFFDKECAMCFQPLVRLRRVKGCSNAPRLEDC